MFDRLAYLRGGLERILSSDPRLAEEIRDKHPRVNAMLRVGVAAEGRGFEESRDAAGDLVGLETIVKKFGRPVLTVRLNDYVFETADQASEVWRARLEKAREVLRRAIPAVGRVEVANNPDYNWVGTAWLLHEEIAVTNRHVAAEFALRKGNGFVFKIDPGFDDGMTSNIDFLQEADSASTRLFEVTKVLYIEPEPGPDIAFLQVARQGGGDRLSPPILLAEAPAKSKQLVAAIGYPARDSRVPDQSLVSQIFGNIYDKKRLAPGEIRSVGEQILTHDASTLGGNSGSVLIDLETGGAVALHRAGLYLADNYAVPAALLLNRLNRVRENLVPVAGPIGSDDRPDDPAVPQAPAIAVSNASSTVAAGNGTRMTWTIPLQVTVNLGSPVAGGLTVATAHPTTSQPTSAREAASSLKQTLLGRAGVVNVRPGYVMKNGWITDERAVVVAVRGDVGEVPRSVAGVPVRVTPASPWDLADAESLQAALERVPTTHYRPPTNVELTEVDEKMRVVCHASPDAGWPTLQTFLDGPIKRLTLGIYDFTAPHIIEAIKSAIRKAPSEFNLVIQHGAAMEGEAKQFDVPDEKVVQRFGRLLGDRLKQAWASVSGPGRLFASSYHIKVAVRDGEAFWLSSGNLQSSNQPDIAPADSEETTFGPLRSFNREWHVIVENAALAKQFEKFLLWDLKEASALEEEAVEAEGPMVLLSADALAREAPEPEAAARARYFPPLTVNRRVRVMPLLTPDNYQPQVLKLLKGAKKSILFQNQSLSPLGDNDEERFRELLETLRDKQEELEDVRIIVRGDFNPSAVLEKLKDFGFDTSKIRFQRKCHTKGIVVDSKRVVVGSHNWTNQGTLVNRDASLIFFDEEIAKYYKDLFEFDWRHMAKARVDEEAPPMQLAAPGQPTPEGMVKVPLRDLLYGDG